MVALESAIGLEDELRVPVTLRASLINGCVYCLNLQSKEGLDARERRERLFGFAARGASSPRRRARPPMTSGTRHAAASHPAT